MSSKKFEQAAKLHKLRMEKFEAAGWVFGTHTDASFKWTSPCGTYVVRATPGTWRLFDQGLPTLHTARDPEKLIRVAERESKRFGQRGATNTKAADQVRLQKIIIMSESTPQKGSLSARKVLSKAIYYAIKYLEDWASCHHPDSEEAKTAAIDIQNMRTIQNRLKIVPARTLVEEYLENAESVSVDKLKAAAESGEQQKPER